MWGRRQSKQAMVQAHAPRLGGLGWARVVCWRCSGSYLDAACRVLLGCLANHAHARLRMTTNVMMRTSMRKIADWRRWEWVRACAGRRDRGDDGADGGWAGVLRPNPAGRRTARATRLAQSTNLSLGLLGELRRSRPSHRVRGSEGQALDVAAPQGCACGRRPLHSRRPARGHAEHVARRMLRGRRRRGKAPSHDHWPRAPAHTPKGLSWTKTPKRKRPPPRCSWRERAKDATLRLLAYVDAATRTRVRSRTFDKGRGACAMPVARLAALEKAPPRRLWITRFLQTLRTMCENNSLSVRAHACGKFNISILKKEPGGEGRGLGE